jgi:hypothetical protein
VSLLLPDGITHLDDLPYTHHAAIVRALAFLSFEELPEEERPPHEIWWENDLMKEHFKRVRAAREAKYGLESGSNMRDEPIEGPVERNAAMDGLLV